MLKCNDTGALEGLSAGCGGSDSSTTDARLLCEVAKLPLYIAVKADISAHDTSSTLSDCCSIGDNKAKPSSASAACATTAESAAASAAALSTGAELANAVEQGSISVGLADASGTITEQQQQQQADSSTTASSIQAAAKVSGSKKAASVCGCSSAHISTLFLLGLLQVNESTTHITSTHSGISL